VGIPQGQAPLILEICLINQWGQSMEFDPVRARLF